MAIRDVTWQKLEKRLENLGLKEQDLEETFIRGSGKGGQKLNKSSTCVFLKHTPTGLEVKCQKSRSREENRYFARERLADKLEELLLGEKAEKRQEIEKIRRQKRKRTKRAQEKVLQIKKQRGQIKRERQSPQIDL